MTLHFTVHLSFSSVFIFYWIKKKFFLAYRILVLQPGMESKPLALEAQRVDYWTAREVPTIYFNRLLDPIPSLPLPHLISYYSPYTSRISPASPTSYCAPTSLVVQTGEEFACNALPFSSNTEVGL